MSNRLKILVTGASGFLGWNLCHRAASKYEVLAVYNSHPIPGSPFQCIELDITDYALLKDTLLSQAPGAVIHCAAQSSPNACQQDPAGSEHINVTAAANIAGLCAEMDIPCIFTSSDLVFDGQHAPYSENDAVGPLSIYGEQKVRAESLVLENCLKAAVCRMPLMYGEAGPGGGSFIQPMVESLIQGRPLSLFTDEIRTPVDGASAADGLLMVLDTGYHGILHLGGRERLGRYQFGLLLANELGADTSYIKPCTQADVKSPAPRPADVSLDSSKSFSLGYNPGIAEYCLQTYLDKKH